MQQENSKSIEQRAVDFAGDRSQGGGHGYPSWQARLIEKGYVKGAQDQKKLMFSQEDMKRAFDVGFQTGYTDEESPSYLTFEKWIPDYKKK